MDSSRDTSVEDEEAILLALRSPGRVRRIGLTTPAANLLKPVMVMDGNFSVLERLFIWSLMHDASCKVSGTAPLHVLTLPCSPSHAISITHKYCGPRLPRALGGAPLDHFRPNNLASRLVSMPQLRSLSIDFKYSVPTRDVEGNTSMERVLPFLTFVYALLEV